MSYLYASDFLFRNFCNLAQHTETMQKKVEEKSNDAYSLLIRVQTKCNDKPHFNLFFTTISTPAKEIFFRARAEKGIARHINVSIGMDCCRQPIEVMNEIKVPKS